MSAPTNTSICSAENALSSYLHSLYGLAAEEPEIVEEASINESYPDVFDVMLFQVAGITLAIEPKSITSITTTTDMNSIDPCSHFDLSKLMQSGNRITSQGGDPLYHIHIEGLGQPLLSEFVGGVVPVYKTRINWRTSTGKRKWLAGTMPGLKCGLIDVPGLIKACNGIQSA